MKIFLFIISLGLMLISCEKEDPDFDQIADDKLIYEGVDLQPSTWEKLDSLTYLSFGDISFLNENVGIVDGFGGTVYITKDGGNNWRTIETHKMMTFHCVYALNEKTFFAARFGVFKSVNDGVSWITCNFPEDNCVFDIWFRDSLNGFLSCNSGTYKTTDAGDRWRKVSSAIAHNVQFTSKDIGYFSYGSTAVTKADDPDLLPSHGDIYRTTNGGNTWYKMRLEVREITNMSFISDKIGFFTTNDGALYKTSDGGESCILLDTKDFYIYGLFFVNENQGYFCTGNGIFLTLDGGYTLLEEYATTGNNTVYQFEFPSPTVGYAIGHYGLIIKRL